MSDSRRRSIALVTGAGSPTGIGFAIARALGRAGHRIAITSTSARIEDRAGELRADGIDAVGFAADLTDSEQVSTLVAEVGDVEILVNNAGMASLGVSDPTGPLEDIATATWAITLERKLTTTFLVTRACLRGMKTRKSGRIVSVASTTGPVTGIAYDAAYAAAKAGILGLTRAAVSRSCSRWHYRKRCRAGVDREPGPKPSRGRARELRRLSVAPVGRRRSRAA